MLIKKRAVIFDMDGLMFDTENLTFQAQSRLAEKLGMPFSMDYYMETVGLSDKVCYEKFIRDFGDNENTHRFARDYKKETHALVREQGVPEKKGLRNLLKFLHRNEIVCVVASSNQRYDVELFLETSGLKKYFHSEICGDEVREAKPEPEIFLKAAELAAAPLEACLVLEDSLNGIRSAHAAGIDVVMVPDLIAPTEEAEKKSLEIFPDLDAVRDWLEERRLIESL